MSIYYRKANATMKAHGSGDTETAETLALQALHFIASDGERLRRFLAMTGIDPMEIEAAARETGFLAGVLEYLASDERLIAAFAADTALDPTEIVGALSTLRGPNWQREIP